MRIRFWNPGVADKGLDAGEFGLQKTQSFPEGPSRDHPNQARVYRTPLGPVQAGQETLG
jgi:hypothetical protein